MPAVINYGGRYYYIGKNGITEDAKSALVVSTDTVRGIVIKATEFSLYSVNNQLVKGYITISGGIRLGVCGEIVRDGGFVKTIKNFTSVNIRIPHEIPGCSLTACSFINDTRLRSALIAAPPEPERPRCLGTYVKIYAGRELKIFCWLTSAVKSLRFMTAGRSLT